MKRWLLGVVVFVACDQGAPHDRSAPPPHTEQASVADRAHVLADVYTKLTTTKRRHTPLEAPTELTAAYVDLEFAYGFARVGEVDRAKRMRTDAIASLAQVSSDPVHAHAIAWYSARIDQALAHASPYAPLVDIEARASKLDRITRYKIDRLGGVSRALAPNESVDAIDEWVKRRDPRGAIANARGHVGGERARALLAAIDASTHDPSGPHENNAQGDVHANAKPLDANLIAVLDAALSLPAPDVAPILARVEELLPTVSVEQQPAVAASAAYVAARNKLSLATFIPYLAKLRGALWNPAPDRPLRESFFDAVDALVLVGDHRALTTLLEQLEPNVGVDLHGQLSLARGWFALGNVKQARRVSAPAIAMLHSKMILPLRLDVTRSLLFAYAHAPPEEFDRVQQDVLAGFADISDSYGTNSHYCISVIDVADAFVIALAGD